METTRKTLLANRDLRREFGLGRDLAGHLAKRLPHIRAGRSGAGEKVLVDRADLERLLERAKGEGADLWELVRAHDAASLKVWLEGATPEAA